MKAFRIYSYWSKARLSKGLCDGVLNYSYNMQVSSQVNQYEQLGPEFEALTGKYHKLLEELRHAEYTLQEFQQAARASDGSP